MNDGTRAIRNLSRPNRRVSGMCTLVKRSDCLTVAVSHSKPFVLIHTNSINKLSSTVGFLNTLKCFAKRITRIERRLLCNLTNLGTGEKSTSWFFINSIFSFFYELKPINWWRWKSQRKLKFEHSIRHTIVGEADIHHKWWWNCQSIRVKKILLLFAVPIRSLISKLTY